MMMTSAAIPEGLVALAHGIQLAVAPVFLLTAIGAMLGVLVQRLARIVDRSRQLHALLEQSDAATHARFDEELDNLELRSRVVNWSMAFATGAAVLIAVVTAGVFVGELARVDLSVTIAVTFVGALFLYIIALLMFLREVHLALTTVRMGRAPRINSPGKPSGA
jgi:hypothetical protein